MATVTTLGTANSATSGATLASPSITAAAGDWIVAAVGADNAGASGASSTSSTITDASGNTPVQRAETNYSPGNASNDGTTLNLFAWPITAAMTAASVTLNFSPNTTARVAAFWKATPDAGKTIIFHSVDALGAKGTGTAWDAPAASVPLGGIIFGAVVNESGNPGTADADTTDGTWSAGQSATANTGTSGTSQSMRGQYKIVTAAGSQSYGQTSASSRDWAANYLILQEVIAGALAATDAPDVAAVAAGPGVLGTMAATDAVDTAAILAGPGILGAMAASDPPDAAAFIAPTSAPRAGTRSVRILLRVDWPDGQVSRYWIGNGAFMDADGQLWRGAALVTGFDELERAVNRESPSMTLALNGVTAEPAAMIWGYYKAGNLIDAQIRWLLQSCDDQDQPQGAPRIVFTGYFANVVFDDQGGETPTSMISVDIQNKFMLRRTPNWAVLSDADQKARSAVLNPLASPDRFAERVSTLENKTVAWPRF